MGISKRFPGQPKQKYRKTKSPICFPIGPFRCRQRQNQLLGHRQLVVMEELFQELCAHQTVWSYPGKKQVICNLTSLSRISCSFSDSINRFFLFWWILVTNLLSFCDNFFCYDFFYFGFAFDYLSLAISSL